MIKSQNREVARMIRKEGYYKAIAWAVTLGGGMCLAYLLVAVAFSQ